MSPARNLKMLSIFPTAEIFLEIRNSFVAVALAALLSMLSLIKNIASCPSTTSSVVSSLAKAPLSQVGCSMSCSASTCFFMMCIFDTTRLRAYSIATAIRHRLPFKYFAFSDELRAFGSNSTNNGITRTSTVISSFLRFQMRSISRINGCVMSSF